MVNSMNLERPTLLLQNTFSDVSAVLMYCRCATIAAAYSWLDRGHHHHVFEPRDHRNDAAQIGLVGMGEQPHLPQWQWRPRICFKPPKARLSLRNDGRQQRLSETRENRLHRRLGVVNSQLVDVARASTCGFRNPFGLWQM